MPGSTPVARATARTHYIIVRRDLPFGTLCAVVAHAAGESFYQFAWLGGPTLRTASDASALVDDAGGNPAPATNLRPRSSESERPVLAGRSVVHSHPGAPDFRASDTIAVVLGARNESRLMKLAARLSAAGIPHVAIREPDAPWNGQLMALGLMPAPRDTLAHHLRDVQLLTESEQTIKKL